MRGEKKKIAGSDQPKKKSIFKVIRQKELSSKY